MFNFQPPVPLQISTMALNCLDVSQSLQIFLIARASKAQAKKAIRPWSTPKHFLKDGIDSSAQTRVRAMGGFHCHATRDQLAII